MWRHFRAPGPTTSVLALLATLALPVALQAQDGFSVEQVLASPFPSSLTATASGQRLAWVFTLRGVANVWVAEGPAFQARSVTRFDRDDGRPLSVLGFSPDGQWLFFSRSSAFNPDHQRLGSGPSKLYRVAWSGGEPEPLAETATAAVSPVEPRLAWADGGALWLLEPGQEPTRVLETRGVLSQPRWSPDGQRLLATTTRGEFPHRYGFVVLYDLKADEVRYIDPSVYLDTQAAWSPDGKRVAFLRRLTGGHRFLLTAKAVPVPDPWEIRVAEASTGRTVRAWRSPDDDTFESAELGWFDDARLVFRSEQDGWAHLYLVGADGTGLRQLTRGEFEVEAFRAVPELGRVFVTCNRDDIDRRHIWSVGAEGPMEAVTGGASIEWSPVPSGDGQHLAHFGSDAVTPAHVYVRRLDGGEATKLAPEALVPDFPSAQLVEPEPVVLQTEDGWSIHGQLFLPPERFTGRRPAMMFFHGGPIRQMLLGFHYGHYYHRAYAMNQYLASRGYVVLAVNFRLGIGYGRAFRDVPDGGPHGGSEYRDLLAGARLLRGHERVDPDRIGLWGGSYGGLMTALGLARNSELFAAGVDLHGVHDWNQWQAWASGEANDEGRTEWRSSPIADIDAWRSPVLLIHGDDDRNVPFSETKWLVEKLDALGVDHELLIFPDDVHSFLLHRNWVRAFEATSDFLDRKLSADLP